jgi:hypothetical protein
MAAVLRERPGRVLAAALLLHGVLATREPAGPGSGHALAWCVTANFLHALLAPGGVQRLSDSARGYAAVAVAAAAARQQAAAAAAHNPAVRQQQQQQQHNQGPQPMQVDARPAAHRAAAEGTAAHGGLVGAARRKSSKPRSTQEALAVALPPPPPAAASSGGRRATAAAAGAYPGDAARRSQRQRRRNQPSDRSEAEIAVSGATRRNVGNRRGSPGLGDLLLPSDQLPTWGKQRMRRGM